jgi:hypothetical protein
MAEYAYSLVQYVPDPAREERMNVGVVVASPAGDFLAGKLATQRDLGRLRRLGLALETEPLARLGESLSVSARTPDQLVVNAGAPWTYEALRRASAEWGGTLQFSAPRPVVHEQPDALLHDLYARLVADPAPRRQRARDRRWVNRRVREGLQSALAARVPTADPTEHIQRNVRVAGVVETHQFDFQLLNGRPLQLVRTLSFEGANDAALRNEVDATAWAIEDVHRAHSDLPCAVVTIGSSGLVDRASRAYLAYGAELVREPELGDWLDIAATRLALALASEADPAESA